MNTNYLKTSKESVVHGKHDYYISSNYDEANSKFLPKLSYKQIYDLSATYPVDDYKELKKSIKTLFGLKNVVLSTGCEDLIIKFCEIINKSKGNVGVIVPTFYRITDNLKSYKSIPWDKIQTTNYKKLNYVFVINPNSLNGQAVSKKDILELVKGNPKTIFIVDETSILFLENWRSQTLSSVSHKFNNLVVISSLSKFFGLSGLRIGFASGSRTTLSKFKIDSATFPISNLSSFIAKSVISNEEFIEYTRQRILKNKKQVIDVLEKTKKVKLFSSNNNCIYCYFADGLSLHKTLDAVGIVGLDLDCQKGIKQKGLVRLTIHGSDKKHKFLINKLEQII